MPLIQYRIIDGYPALIGIRDAIDIIKGLFFDLNEITILDKQFVTNEREVCFLEESLGISEDYKNYIFSSPWLALNQENHKSYKQMHPIEQKRFLNRILKNNLLTLSKGFEYWIENFDKVELEGWFHEIQVNFKNRKLIGFKGEFTTNFAIPKYFGLGKQSARGFGVVELKKEG